MGAGLVVVGGSYAALTIAKAARESGYAEPMLIISEERYLPYHRPPLSKGLLTGKVQQSSLPLQVEQFYREHKIDVLMETRVHAIDRQARQVTVGGGRTFAYDRLGLAVGARPRLLSVPGADLPGVLYLRSLDDALAIKQAALDARSVVVIGAGYIGLEVTSALADGTRKVAVVELADRPLARVTTPTMSSFIAERHHKAGVRILVQMGVDAIVGDSGKVRGVKCSDGTLLEADLVVVGAGVVPNIELAQSAGLACDNGIAVDEAARTSDPTIVAAGDCANFYSRRTDCRLRLESVQNAFDQADAAGKTTAGQSVAYDPVPWFWSDQYELKIQTVGIIRGYDREVLRGDPASGRFSLYYLKQSKLIAIDSINRPADHMLGRRLLAAGLSASPEQIADSSFDLKSLLPAPAPKPAAANPPH